MFGSNTLQEIFFTEYIRYRISQSDIYLHMSTSHSAGGVSRGRASGGLLLQDNRLTHSRFTSSTTSMTSMHAHGGANGQQQQQQQHMMTAAATHIGGNGEHAAGSNRIAISDGVQVVVPKQHFVSNAKSAHGPTPRHLLGVGVGSALQAPVAISSLAGTYHAHGRSTLGRIAGAKLKSRTNTNTASASSSPNSNSHVAAAEEALKKVVSARIHTQRHGVRSGLTNTTTTTTTRQLMSQTRSASQITNQRPRTAEPRHRAGILDDGYGASPPPSMPVAAWGSSSVSTELLSGFAPRASTSTTSLPTVSSDRAARKTYGGAVSMRRSAERRTSSAAVGTGVAAARRTNTPSGAASFGGVRGTAFTAPVRRAQSAPGGKRSALIPQTAAAAAASVDYAGESEVRNERSSWREEMALGRAAAQRARASDTAPALTITSRSSPSVAARGSNGAAARRAASSASAATATATATITTVATPSSPAATATTAATAKSPAAEAAPSPQVSEPINHLIDASQAVRDLRESAAGVMDLLGMHDASGPIWRSNGLLNEMLTMPPSSHSASISPRGGK